MKTSIRSFAINLSFLSSLTRHCCSEERNPLPRRADNSSSYLRCSSWSLRNSSFSAVRRSIKASVSGMHTSLTYLFEQVEDAQRLFTQSVLPHFRLRGKPWMNLDDWRARAYAGRGL